MPWHVGSPRFLHKPAVKAPWSTVPLLIPATALMAGVVVGFYSLWPLAIALLLAAALAGIYARTVTMTACIISLSGYALGYFSIPHRSEATVPEPYDIVYTGTVKRVSETRMGTSVIVDIRYWSLDSAGHRESCSSRPVKLIILDNEHDISPHATIKFTASLRRIDDEPDLPDETLIAESPERAGIFYHAIISNDDILKVEPAPLLWRMAAECKSWLTHRLYNAGMKPEAALFTNAIITADTAMLDPDFRDDFARAGLAHLLALSGMHVGLIAMIAGLALWPLSYFGHRKLTALLTIVLLWCFALVTGLGTSVVRAVTMASIYLAARLFERKAYAMNSLMAAAMLIVIFSPRALFEISFQLSFSAVASIILFTDALCPFSRRRKWLYAIGSYLSLSVAAMAGTAVVSIIYFHRLPLYFLFSNALTALLLPPAIGVGLLIIIVSGLGAPVTMLAAVADFIYECIYSVATFTAGLPGASIDNIYIPAWSALPYFMMLLCLAAALHGQGKRWLTLTSAGILCITFATIIALEADEEREQCIYFTHSHDATDMVITSLTMPELIVVTDAPTHAIPEIKEHLTLRYAEYMKKRDITTLTVVNDTLDRPGISLRDNMLRVGDKRIALLPMPGLPADTLCADIAVVRRGKASEARKQTRSLTAGAMVVFSDKVKPEVAEKLIAGLQTSPADTSRFISLGSQRLRLPW